MPVPVNNTPKISGRKRRQELVWLFNTTDGGLAFSFGFFAFLLIIIR